MRLPGPLRRLRERDRAIGEAVAEHGAAAVDRLAAIEELRAVMPRLREPKANGNGHGPNGRHEGTDDDDHQ